MVINLQFLSLLANPPYSHLIIILLAFFITYFTILGKTYYWTIDCLEGIARFSDKWDDKQQKKIDYYELEGKTWKNTQWNPTIGFPGNIYRFLRLNIGKKLQVIGKNSKGHDIFGYVQSPRKHRMISMTVQVLNLIMAYTFLCHIIPAPIAFGATLLYAVSPLTTCSVVWAAGYNYNFSMFFSLALLNVALTCLNPELRYFSVALLSFMATITIYTGAFTCILLWFLGLKIEAVIAAIVGFGICAWKGLETKKFRVEAFKAQNMAETTIFKPRRIIIIFKTLAYYMGSIWLPLRLGLYHSYQYWPDEPLEHIDKMFWTGILVALISIYSFFHFGFVVKFGILWFYSFWILFSNFIVAQQAIADRYVMVPSFGICIILSYFLHGTPLFWVIVGLYAMRTYLHLPTYKNEVDFYASNFLNFRKSEVALGNLGVAFINQGMMGAAVDTWMLATKLNPQYDVPWYNLYSVYKSNGRLSEARDFLKKCMDAKIVHFDKKWAEELKDLENYIEHSKTPVNKTELFYHEAADHYKSKDIAKEYQALKNFMVGDSSGLIPEMITQVKERIKEIESNNLLSNHPVSGQTGPQITGPHPVNPSTGVSAGSN